MGFSIAHGNVVSAVSQNQPALIGFKISRGPQEFSFPLDATDHITSPAARSTNVYVAGGSDL